VTIQVIATPPQKVKRPLLNDKIALLFTKVKLALHFVTKIKQNSSTQ
jgi:hypothetical protein